MVERNKTYRRSHVFVVVFGFLFGCSASLYGRFTSPFVVVLRLFVVVLRLFVGILCLLCLFVVILCLF